MLLTVVRYTFFAFVTAYATYRLNAIAEDYRNNSESRDTSQASRRRQKCVICLETVEPSQEYQGSCGCLRHNGCMRMLIEEGQDVCPRCRAPLSNDSASNAIGRR